MAKQACDLAKYAERMAPRLKASFLYSHREKGSGRHTVRRHSHPSWQMDLITAGSCVLVDESGTRMALAEGEGVLIPPGRGHSFLYRRDGAGWMSFWFALEGLALERPIHLRRSEFSQALFAALRVLVDAEEEGASRSRAAALGDCLAALIGRSEAMKEDATPSVEGLAGKAALWSERSEGRRVDIKEIADALGCSASYLSHAFKKEFGRSMKSALDERRAGVLKRLLGQEELRPAQIAASLGFRDLGELSRFCRRHLGASPRGLRRNPSGGD
jgi:AraC-like DNA-binding protein